MVELTFPLLPPNLSKVRLYFCIGLVAGVVAQFSNRLLTYHSDRKQVSSHNSLIANRVAHIQSDSQQGISHINLISSMRKHLVNYN